MSRFDVVNESSEDTLGSTENLSDAICAAKDAARIFRAKWRIPEQRELGALLARQREGSLDGVERHRLNELMDIYRRGMVQKAQALKVAVDRGLQPPLS